MRIFKKFIVAICISVLLILCFIPSSAEAALSEAQRAALVKVTVDIVKNGNNNRVLRYSQKHRTSGYAWTKVRNHSPQTTASKVSLSKTDQDRVLQAIKEDILKRYPRDEKMQAIAASLTLKKTTYICTLLGRDIYDTIAFDCSSLCSAVYNMTFGTSFDYPWTSVQFSKGANTYSVTSDLSTVKPGDILWREGHVAIYLGNYDGEGVERIAEATGIVVNSASTKAELSNSLAEFFIKNPKYAVEHPNYQQYQPTLQLSDESVIDAGKQVIISTYNPSKWKKVATYIGEVRQGKVIDVSGTTTSNDGSTNGGLTPDDVKKTEIELGTRTGSVHYWPDNYTIEEQALSNSEGYFHKGIPAYGGYTPVVTPFNWLIENAKDVLDWFIGFITMALRIEIIGWTSIVENLISNALAVGTQDVNNSETEESKGLDIFGAVPIETTNKATVEDIIFNNVPLLDINFFNFSEAAGQKLSDNSIIYKIRELIAQWYYTIRTIVILLMLVILLYNTVKVMFTTIASDKAEAKKKLIDWIVGFAIVFFIHYFMIGVIGINNQLVETLKPDTVAAEQSESNGSITQSNEKSLYEQIRIQAYDISAVTGWAGTFMYVAMVVYLFIFLFMYVKRLFILAILTVISPCVGALYAFNKKQYGLTTWGKEYIYNIIIQLIHAVLYISLISIALAVAKTSTIVGGIIALIFMAFMFPMERLVKRIFGYESKALGGLSDSVVGQLGAYALGAKATKTLASKASVTKDIAKTVGDKAIHNKAIDKLKETKYGKKAEELYDKSEAGIKAATVSVGEYMKDTANTAMRKTGITPVFDISDKSYNDYYNKYYDDIKIRQYKPSDDLAEAIRIKEERLKKARKEFAKNRYRILTNSIIATAGLSLAVPLLVVDRGKGASALFFGGQAFKNAFTRKKIKGIKRKPNNEQNGLEDGMMKKAVYKGGKLLFVTATSPILAKAYSNAWHNSIDEKEALDNYQRKAKKELEDLKKAKLIEMQIAETMKEMYKQTEEDPNQKHSAERDYLKERVKVAEKAALRSSLRTSLANFERDDIKKVVSDYMKEKGINKASLKDIRDIRDRLNRELRDRGVTGISVSEALDDNIRDEVRKQTRMVPGVKKVTEDENGNKKTEVKARVEVKDIEKICREIAKDEKVDNVIIKDLVSELKKDRHFRVVVETQNMEAITEKIKDKLEEKIKDNQANENMKKAIEERLNQRVEEKTKETETRLNEEMQRLKPDELVKVITNAVNSEGAIDVHLRNNRYNNLMQDVRKLEEINKDYYKLTGKPIYDDVGKLIETMRDGLVKNRR